MSGASNTSQLHKQIVSAKFCDQMHELTDTLNATRCNFIRCIKPNPTMSPGIFDHGYVVDQLRCSGMLATCELLKVGLPTRVGYEEICRIYKPVLPPSVTPMFDAYNDPPSLSTGQVEVYGVLHVDTGRHSGRLRSESGAGAAEMMFDVREQWRHSKRKRQVNVALNSSDFYSHEYAGSGVSRCWRLLQN
ncbi:hypothetical protein PsorP6_012811 [Peronosclerospora sorghi]|uniref:Uncharacterized protein n=1 Tax=Peronosclerospora sorghi TaxID=230839 RepID=A0ACC0WGT3_9STRA|nr:hypothetical protein PsorP6_012811 [Peronosclerospora sorghi]